MKILFSRYKVKPRFINLYNPTSKSISERVNQTVGYVLRVEKKSSSVKEMITKIESNSNYNDHWILKVSPVERLFGYNLNDLLKRRSRVRVNKI